MKYKVKILKEPQYKEGGSKETVKKGMPSTLLYQIELAKKQIAKKGVPKVTVDKFGIPTDQYGNKYYKPYGTNTYKLDPNQKGGYWSHVVNSAKDKSGKTGWNESDYKKQEFSKINELLNPFDRSPDKYSFTEELGSLFRVPQNSLNALLTNNYEPMSVSRRRYTDPKFDPNSGLGIGLDVLTDPMIFPEIPYFLGKQSVRGLKYVAPILADYAVVAGKYVGKKAKIVSELALKYGKKTAQFVVENAPELYDKVSRFKYALNKGGNEIDNQNDDYQKAMLQYSATPQQNSFVKQTGRQNNQRAIPATSQQFPSQQFFAPQVGPIVMQPSSYKRAGSMTNNPTINSRNAQQQNSNNNEEQVLQYRGGNKNSLVDLLKYNDMDSSMASRKKLAEDVYGIENYTGTYEQNVKLKNLLENNYQDGGSMQQEEGQEQILQIIQAYAEASGVDPKELMTKLQSLGEEEQQQAITQMYQALQGGGQEEEQGYAQEQMQPGMQQQMGYGEEEDEEDGMQMAAYGGQMGYGLDLGSRRLWMNQDGDEQSMVNRSIKKVPRDLANIEAEGGETALVPNKNDNGHSHFNIQGNRHTQGGVPLNVPEGTFIYSDTKKMKLGGSVLSVFGKSDKTNKKYTPAALAKQYNLNKYTAILESPKSSQLERRTAELMIQNFNKKLAQLALVQEGKKGYPQGIPKVAEEYYAKTKAYVESKQGKNQPQQEMQEQQSGEDFDQDMEQDQQMQAMYGMGFKYGGGLQRFQGDVNGSQFNGVPYSYDKPELTQNDLLGNYTTEGNNQGIVNSDNNYSLNSLTTPTYSSLGIKMPANKYSGFGMQNTQNYDDPNLIGIDLGMQKNRNYLPEEDQGVFKLGLQKPYDAETTENDDKKKEDKEAIDKSNLKYGWTNPDKLNLLNSYINLASVKRTTPFEPATKFERNITMYADPARALAANTEQYNAARQAASMFAGPQSRYSLNAGQFGKNAADIIGQYANQNIRTGNIAADQAADTNNKQILYDAQRAKRLYDAGVIGEQQYQNAMRQARAGVLQAYNQGTKNATDLYNMSMTESPFYNIDYSKGAGLVRFVRGKEGNYFAQKANDNSNSDYAAMTKAGYINFDDWSKSLGYASYDQLMKARVANAKMATAQK